MLKHQKHSLGRLFVRIGALSPLALSLGVGFAAAQSPTAAPSQPQTKDAPVSEEIVVTGSRLTRKDFEAASPVVTVSAAKFEEFGVTSPDILLNTLPLFTPNFGASSNNPANAGIASANLRGLGANRTLVLIDGKRTVSSDGSNSVDISQIPTALIKSVEVTTGGASAVYGSDAIVGVVNFLLDNRFVGWDVTAQYGQTAESDGAQKALDVVYGWQDDANRGGVQAYATYMDRGGVLATDRPKTAFPVSVTFDASGNPVFSRTVVTSLADGVFVPTLTNLPSQASVDAVFGGYGARAGVVQRNAVLGFNDDNSLFALNPRLNYRGGATVPDPYYRNSTEFSFLQLPIERYTAGVMGQWRLNTQVELYGRFSGVNSTVERAISPGTLTITNLMPVTNPFIPADLRTILQSRASPNASFSVTRNLPELGPRAANFETNLYQAVLGGRGEITPEWRWDAFVSRGHVGRIERQPGSFRTSRVLQLLSSPGSGASLCAGGLDLFGPNGVSRACADFISYTPEYRTFVDQTVAEASVSGSMFSLPGGKAQLAVGAAYRENKFNTKADPLAATGDVVGFRGGQSLRASVDTREVFAEASLPLVANQPFVELLEVGLGARRSDYSTVGTADAYKADLVYAPVAGLRFRSSIQRAVRVPDFNEAFLAPSTYNENLIEDPCSANSTFRTGALPGVDPARIRALCIAQGIPSAAVDSFVGPRAISGVLAGNANLEPETADTLSLGFVWKSPSDAGLLKGLSVAADYYKIEISDLILQTAVDPLLRRCYNLNGGNTSYDPNNAFCQAFSRNPAGNLVNAAASFRNLAAVELDGIDAQIDYGFDIAGAGRVTLNLVASYLLSGKQQDLSTEPFVDYTGTIGSSTGTVFPEWKTTLSAGWASGPARLGLRWRHISEMETRAKRLSPTITSLGTPATDYLDLTGAWDINTALRVSFGVDNLTDQEPPIYSTPLNADLNTDPNTFDTIGRRFFLRLNAKF